MGRLLPSCTMKEWLIDTASSSRPNSGSTAVREEEVSDGAGKDSRASKDGVGEIGAGIVLQSTGLSPYFMVHGVKPLFPFDLVKAIFLIPPPDTELLSSSGLIAWRACQLQKHQEDLESIREHVLKARFESVKHFKAAFKNRIKDFDFRAGSLVLVRNT